MMLRQLRRFADSAASDWNRNRIPCYDQILTNERSEGRVDRFYKIPTELCQFAAGVPVGSYASPYLLTCVR